MKYLANTVFIGGGNVATCKVTAYITEKKEKFLLRGDKIKIRIHVTVKQPVEILVVHDMILRESCVTYFCLVEKSGK